MKYDVGNILWVVGTERPGLRIYRVVEEVTKKSLQGVETTYQLEAAGPKSKSKTIAIEKISGEIFNSAEEAEVFMLESAKNAIDSMVKKAEFLIEKCWPSEKVQPLTEVQPAEKNEDPPRLKNQVQEDNEDDDEYHYVDLEDGTRARIKIPNF